MPGVATSSEWVLLAYRLPREPSTPRISVWRKLRRLGALQLVDGLVALPASTATAEAFDWLADEVIDAGGEVWTWRATPGSKAQHGDLVSRINDAIAGEYEALVAEVGAAGHEPPPRTAQRLRRALHRVQARDHFGAPGKEAARRAVERLATTRDREGVTR